MNYRPYLEMQDRYYESDLPSDHIVGNVPWHENFPYETLLLYRNGDVRFPLLQDPASKVALDFACGPGRMVARMSKIFRRVDGVDISSRLLAEAKRRLPNSTFYHSAGDDLGEAPRGAYDFIYSTIAMQHIAHHGMRLRIWESMADALAPGGAITIQMAFHPHFPYVGGRALEVGGYRIKVARKTRTHAGWLEDRVDATGTNSACDVGMGSKDLDTVVSEFGSLFGLPRYWFYDVGLIYADLEGEVHDPRYWASHWIFLSGQKK